MLSAKEVVAYPMAAVAVVVIVSGGLSPEGAIGVLLVLCAVFVLIDRTVGGGR